MAHTRTHTPTHPQTHEPRIQIPCTKLKLFILLPQLECAQQTLWLTTMCLNRWEFISAFALFRMWFLFVGSSGFVVAFYPVLVLSVYCFAYTTNAMDSTTKEISEKTQIFRELLLKIFGMQLASHFPKKRNICKHV